MDVQAIEEAANRIRQGIYASPCPHSVPLSTVAGAEIFCKLDHLQRTGSFKERGARNALLLLDGPARERGVVAASAGNHALGLAHHGRELGIPVTVVMPTSATLAKVTVCEDLGAEVVLQGASFAEAQEHARNLERDRGLTYVHGFDDPGIIAGQGTIAIEVIEQVPDVDAILVPIGGGGLVAGVAVAIRGRRPDVEVIGVEPKRAASFTAALEAGRPVTIELGPTLADGLAVSRVGELAFSIAREGVKRVVTVSEAAIARAILRLAELEKSVVEGAGAVGLAALLDGVLPELAGKKVVLLLTGGNIDMTVLGRIIERGLVADGRLSRFEATISDRPGGLARFTSILGTEGASIKEITHDRAFAGEDLENVIVHCIVETRGGEHVARLRRRFETEGFDVRFHESGKEESRAHG